MVDRSVKEEWSDTVPDPQISLTPSQSTDMENGVQSTSRLAEGDQLSPREYTSTPNKFWHGQGEGDAPDVLEPNHPLMKRFQAALNAHLERQKLRLVEEVLGLEATYKKKQLERDELGTSLYSLQQEIDQQQNQLDSYHETLTSFMKMRQEMESKVQFSKSKHKVENENLMKAEKKENELRTELEGLVILERQFTEWEKEMESELTVSQRISEKTKIEKKQLAEDKQKQDILIFRLMTEVSNLESQLKSLDAQYEVKSSEKVEVRQIIADANADLEALKREQHRLFQAWNGVVVSVQKKDQAYDIIKKDLSVEQEQFLTLTYEIEGVKKASTAEMDKNEKLTMLLSNVNMDKVNLERLLKLENEKKEGLEAQLYNTSTMLEETDKDLSKAKVENVKHQHIDKSLQYDIEKLLNEKLKLEDSILDKLQDQMIHDKAAKYLNKLVLEMRDKTRLHELTMVNGENTLTQAMLEVERQKGINNHHKLLLDELIKEVQAGEKHVDTLTHDLSRILYSIRRKQQFIGMLNKQLEEIINKNGSEEVSPLELKVLNLTRTVEDMTEKSESMKQFWLRQQGLVVALSHQRTDQLHEINILQKQVLILNQKNLKIEQEIARHNKEEQDVSRSVNNLLQKLVTLNRQLCDKKDYKEVLDKDNLITQNQFQSVLKDAELELLQLESDIASLQQEKNKLTDMLLDKQTEHLAWEKKLQLALETKGNIKKEQSKGGEVGAMKSEIHRMEVRYSQLRRAQEKLVTDLEYCVVRRESIVDGAGAKEKKSITGAHNMRCNFQKKLEDMRNRIKLVNNEIRAKDCVIRKMEEHQKTLLQHVMEREDELIKLQEAAADMERQLEERQLMKYKNLTTIIHRQHRIKMYEEVKQGQHKLLFRNEHSLNSEMQRQKIIHSDLISVLESLISDFPSFKFKLTKILNTLHLYD